MLQSEELVTDSGDGTAMAPQLVSYSGMFQSFLAPNTFVIWEDYTRKANFLTLSSHLDLEASIYAQ